MVTPPSTPWRTTARRTRRPSARTAGRGSPATVHSARTTVRHPTSAAARRWRGWKRTRPRMGGSTMPKESGQSGTASPEPVEVTSPPTKSSAKVAPAVSTAKRWRPVLRRSAIRSVGCGGGRLRLEPAGLREVVLGDQRRAVFVGAAVHGGEGTREVAVRRRRRGLPLERVRVPRVLLRPLAREHAPEEVDDEDQLARAEDERAVGDERVHRLERLQEVVLRRVVDAAHVAADAEDVHREEGPVEADEGEREMDLAERLVHHAAEHLREPVVDRGEGTEDAAPEDDVMDVCHDEVAVVDVDVDRRGRHEDAREPAD